MKFVFDDIPVEVSWVLFDDANRSEREGGSYGPGSGELEVDAPSSWAEPWVNVRCADGYTIRPDQRKKISTGQDEVMISGDLFYADVDRERQPYELNHQATVNLVTSGQGLTGRTRFFTALVALETHFEYLTFAMLVLSDHRTKGQFDNLNTQFNRTKEAFDHSNTDFFDDPIKLPGNREVPIGEIEVQYRDQMKTIFDEVRKLRNDVVHAWTYKHPERSDLQARFQMMGEQLQIHQPTDDEFFEHATNTLVRLFARVNPLDNRASVLREGYIVAEERHERGYS